MLYEFETFFINNVLYQNVDFVYCHFGLKKNKIVVEDKLLTCILCRNVQ